LLALVAIPPAAAQQYGPVRAGESLWQIAGQIHVDSGLSRDQVMLALLGANPEAFSPPCNLYGILHVGAVLELPPPQQIAAVDAETARRIVEQQRRDWAAHRNSGRPLICEPTPPAAPQPEVAQPPGAERPPSEDRRPPETMPEPAAPSPPTAAPGRPGELPEAAVEPVPEVPTGGAQEQTGQPTGPALPPTPMTAEQPAELAAPAPGVVPTPTAPTSATPTATAPLLAHGEGTAAPLPPGPRAPAWVVAAALLGLIAATLVRWERYTSVPNLKRPAAAMLQAAATLPARASLLLAPGRLALLQLLLLSAIAGFLGALVTILFHEGIRALEWLFSGQSAGVVAMAERLAPWQRLLLPAAGGLVAGLILQQVGGLLRGRASTDYMEAVAVGDGWISVRHSLVKSGSSLVTVGTGGSIGREGAMVQLAAMVASALGRLGRFPRDRLRLLVAAGAAAGLAAAYNAPIAATLFVAEIVLGSIALEHIGPLIIAAVISSATVHDIFGYAPVYEIPAFSLVSDWELALYLLLGVVAGHVAPAFLHLLERARELFGKLPRITALRLGLGGLLVGAISVYEPQVWGNGYSVVNSVLHSPWAWQALLTVLVLKMLATAATHGSGAIGGAFTPTLFVGAMLGALFGTAAHVLLPAGTASPSAYAVVGMGAMLAGATHAPLMSILMVFELTMDYQIVLPLMLAVITAHYTARAYAGVRPMYADSLLPRETPA
jgi:FimV-like protein